MKYFSSCLHPTEQGCSEHGVVKPPAATSTRFFHKYLVPISFPLLVLNSTARKLSFQVRL